MWRSVPSPVLLDEFQLNLMLGVVGFEILTAVATKNSVVWDVGPHSPVKVNQRFGRIYHLHLQG
jgi:hypothetical protein